VSFFLALALTAAAMWCAVKELRLLYQV